MSGMLRGGAMFPEMRRPLMRIRRIASNYADVRPAVEREASKAGH